MRRSGFDQGVPPALQKPPLRLAGPEIDLDSISEFRDGVILLTLTDAEKTLDAANRNVAELTVERDALKRQVADMKAAAVAAGSAALDTADQGGADDADDKGAATGAAAGAASNDAATVCRNARTSSLS